MNRVAVFSAYLAAAKGRVGVGNLPQSGVVWRGQGLRRRRVNCHIHCWKYIHFFVCPRLSFLLLVDGRREGAERTKKGLRRRLPVQIIILIIIAITNRELNPKSLNSLKSRWSLNWRFSLRGFHRWNKCSLRRTRKLPGEATSCYLRWEKPSKFKVRQVREHRQQRWWTWPSLSLPFRDCCLRINGAPPELLLLPCVFLLGAVVPRGPVIQRPPALTHSRGEQRPNPEINYFTK